MHDSIIISIKMAEGYSALNYPKTTKLLHVTTFSQHEKTQEAEMQNAKNANQQLNAITQQCKEIIYPAMQRNYFL